MDKLKSWLIKGAGILAFIAAFGIAKAVVQTLMEGQSVEEALIEGNKAAVAQMNAKGPTMLDDLTELTSTEAQGLRVIYNHTLIGSFASISADFAPQIESHIRETACKEVLIRNNLRDGALMQYRYKDSDGAQIADFTLDRTSCP